MEKAIERKTESCDQKAHVRALVREMNAGCSALVWETEDGKHLWGRNFDFNRIAEGSQVTCLPKGTSFYIKGTKIENNLEETDRLETKYGALGMSSLVLRSTPALFEGMNEKDLMGGQLYYREFASYREKVQEDTCRCNRLLWMSMPVIKCKKHRIKDVGF